MNAKATNGKSRSTSTMDDAMSDMAETVQASFDQWTQWYQGMAKEGFEWFNRAVETAQGSVPSGTPSMDLMQAHANTMMNSFNDLMTQWVETMQTRPTDPQAYKALYEAWLDSCAKQMEVWMKTPEFAAQSGQGLDRMAEMKTKMGDMMENYWETMHLPSTRDMRELYQKLYVMERKLDELDRLVRQSAGPSSKGSSAKKS